MNIFKGRHRDGLSLKGLNTQHSGHAGKDISAEKNKKYMLLGQLRYVYKV